MSWPKRLPEEDYAAIIGKVEAHLREHLPKEVPKGDRSVAGAKAILRIWQADAEGRAIFEAEMSRLEIREEYCRNLIALAEAGDKQAKKQAKADLRMLPILFLEDVIAGRDDVPTLSALFRDVSNEMQRTLPYDGDCLRPRQIQIAIAVDTLMQKLPDIRATRNDASHTGKHPESACSLVARALVNIGRPMSENNVQRAWETYGVCRELIRSKKSPSAN